MPTFDIPLPLSRRLVTSSSAFLLLLLLSSAVSPPPRFIVSAFAPPPRTHRNRGRSYTTSIGSALYDSATNAANANANADAAALDIDEIRRQRRRDAAASFVPTSFDPVPALSNRHLQTISGVYLRMDPYCAYVDRDEGSGGLSVALRALSVISGGDNDDGDGDDGDLGGGGREGVCTFWDHRERVESCRWTETECGLERVEDGDFFHADVKYVSKESRLLWQSEGSKGLVVLVHGLESNSNSSLSVGMAESYVSNGFDCVCLNFRGCCGNPNDTLGGYHLGFTDDLRNFLTIMRDAYEEEGGEYEKKPIYLSGFSLGANVVLKALGELGESAITDFHVRGCAVTGAPFDAERNVRYLDAPGFNRVVYSGNFLRTLKKRAQYNLDRHCEGNELTDRFDYARTMSATSIAEFDDAFIAKVYGFGSNINYYRQCSCLYFLDDIAVPTLIVNAEDDPFFDPDFWPFEKSCEGGGKAPIKMVRTNHGGHLGFMFHQLDDEDKDNVNAGGRKGSWMTKELGRFIQHVHDVSLKHISSE